MSFLRGRAWARAYASRTTRSMPNAVFRLTSVATSCGVPVLIVPPLPVYGPSVPSRTTTKSISGLPASGVPTPGKSLLGRRLTWWSKANRSFSRKPRSSTPDGTDGSPMAPSRIASCSLSSSRSASVRVWPVAW